MSTESEEFHQGRKDAVPSGDERYTYTCLRCRQRQTEDIYMTFCGVEQCPRGFTVGPRTRKNYHLHVILSGRGTLEVRGERFQLHQNQAFLLKPGEEIRYQADQKAPWRYCWVAYNGKRAKSYLDAAGFPDGVNVRDCHVDTHAFLRIVQRLLECTEVTVYNELRRLGLALEFLSLMMESAARGEGAAQRRHDYPPDVYVDHALDMIRLNYAKVTVSALARYIGINRSYLTHIFKRRMGVSPQEYLLRFRLDRGRQLLLTTDFSIQEIGRQVGYENSLTFSKMFKNAYGISPRNYRLRGGVFPEEDKSTEES